MKLLRNAEVLRGVLLFTVISAAAVIYSLYADIRPVVFVSVLCLIFILVHIFITWRRYRRIRSLAYDIDSILHGNDHFMRSSYEEGELAVLESEIYKMIVCLREQRQKLMNDKIYLADSIADISHQLRTPLTSINIIVQLLSKPGINDERRSRLYFELRQLLSRIDWLINTLLKISKLDAGTVTFKREEISLNELIERSCAPLLVSIDLREQTLNIKASGNIIGDTAWNCEAIGNIVKNCTEHTPAGGTITITAEENLLFSEICICDNGSGIPEDDLPHIFERFYKGENSDEKSFGIGLNLARMIVTNQNGTVKAENRKSGGAEFIIKFYKEII